MAVAPRAPGLALFIAAAWMAVVLAVDVANATPQLALTVLFGIAPLIACAVLPPAQTAAVAAAAIILAAASGEWNSTWGTPQHVVRIVDVILVGVAAVVVATVRVRREQQVAALTEVADVAQRAILPVLPNQAGPVAVAARYLPAGRGTLIGGDLYDCYRYASRTTGPSARVRFIVGDVRGKGIAGVEQAARVIRAFRQSAAVEPTLAQVAQAMDSYLAEFFGPEEFVTAVLVDVTDANRFHLVNCGHPAPMLHRAGGGLTVLATPSNQPLGLGLAGTSIYRAVSAPWSAGDRLLLYTDGLSEARDPDDNFLSLLALEPAMGASTMTDLMDAVLAAVTQHTGRRDLADDLAMVALECLGDASPR